MAVYVDQALFPYRGERWCHMWADSLRELLAMADRIGLRRRWLQGPPRARWVHFDLTPARRAAALAAGAIETDRYGPLAWQARLNGDASALARIEALRARAQAEAPLRHPLQPDLLTVEALP